MRPRRLRRGRTRGLPRAKTDHGLQHRRNTFLWLQFATSAAPRRSHFAPSRDGARCDLGGAAEVADALSRVYVRPRRRRGGRRRALPRSCATSAAPRRSQTRSPVCMCDLGGAAEVADALSRVHVRPRRRRGGRRRALPRSCATWAAPRRSQTRSKGILLKLEISGSERRTNRQRWTRYPSRKRECLRIRGEEARNVSGTDEPRCEKG